MKPGPRLSLLLTLMLGATLSPAAPPVRAGMDLGALLAGVSGPNANEVIRRLVENSTSAEFTGMQITAIYRPQRRASRQQVTQKGGRRRITYVEPPALKGKVIDVDGSHLFSAGGETAAPDGLGNDLSRLEKSMLGTERVAGRAAYVIEVRPGGNGGARRIWVDVEEWVPLRWQDRDARGTLVSESAYVTIEFARVSRELPTPRSLDGSRDTPVVFSREDAEREVGFRILIPSYLPKGYRSKAITVNSIGAGKNSVLHATQQFSNDLALLTLSQAPARALTDAPRPGRYQWSANALTWVRGGFYFVMIPPPSLTRQEVEKVAGSVR